MIDTSTTAGKIAVMQAFVSGLAIEAISHNEWIVLRGDVEIAWKWDELDYRIKPQTVEEAAIDYADNTLGMIYSRTQQERGFVAGAQWQKEQDQ